MKWSPIQERAIADVRRWFRAPDKQVFKLFGYAGTGKTTIAKTLAADAGTVHYAAYTGKAASVMRRSGCEDATTIHRLIYQPVEKDRSELEELLRELADAETEPEPDEAKVAKIRRLVAEERARLRSPNFIRKSESEVKDASLLVIDECSMVDRRVGLDLLAYGVPILVLGDPMQLPPVKGGGFFTDGEPDAVLTEVHRQARDNPVLDIATRIREGEKLVPGVYGGSEISDGKLGAVHMRSADQILCGLNATRTSANAQMRADLGYTGEMPNIGERLVCLKNDHKVGLLNGTIWTVEGVGEERENTIRLEIEDEEGVRLDLDVSTLPFKGRMDEVSGWTSRVFDYGYALTVHKSQGSQWDEVAIINECSVFRRDARRWLYTAVTRAAKRVLIGRY